MDEYVLQPPEGSPFLTPDEVLVRLVHEFGFVHVSRKLAREAADQWGQKALEKLKKLGASADAIAHCKRTQVEDPGLEMTVYDDLLEDMSKATAFLNVSARLDTEILIAFKSEEHFAQSKDLVQRAAAALGYEIEYG